MAEIRPFRALRYTEKAGDISKVVCPPYDIVDDEERQQLVEQNPYNMIQLELPIGENRYEKTANLLQQWLDEGVLARDEKPGLYIYEMEFSAHGKDYKVKGLVSRIRLEEYDKKIVLPHELTLSGAKSDRFDLMKATHYNFSSVYGLYRDKSNEIFPYIEELSKNQPDQSFKTPDGITHNIWFVYDEKAIDFIGNAFKGEQIYIADGHHRYGTMIDYRNHLREQGADMDDMHPANFGMMTLMNIDNPGLVVFPTHRLVKDLESFELDRFLDGCNKYFKVDTTAPETLEKDVIALGEEGKTAYGMYYDGKAWLLTLTDDDIMKEILPEMSDAYRRLDVSVLHTLILERLLGIDKENLENQRNLNYYRDAKDTMAQVDSGNGDIAFIINDTVIKDIAAVADADEQMPQKSTYFYPKLITGHVLNPLD